MSKIDEIIESSLTSGTMTQRQHDEVMRLIQDDGEIDDRESAQLAKLVAAVRSGALRIVDSDRAKLQAEKEAELLRKQHEEKSLLADMLEAAETISSAVDRAIESGFISQREHDRILKRIQADGSIDEVEKSELSRLFTAIQSGEVALVEGGRSGAQSKKQRSMLEEEKRLAVERDELRAERHQSNPRPAAGDEAILPAGSQASGFAVPGTAPTESSSANEQVIDTLPLTGTAARPGPERPIERLDAAAEPSDTLGLSELLRTARSRRVGGRTFELQNDRMLDVNLNGKVWMKSGAMVGYFGIIKFTREGFLEHGVSRLVKKTVTGEGAMLTKATGQGNLYLADQGKKISIVNLRGHSLVVNGTNLLAFEETVKWDITLLKQFAAIWKGGLFNVRLSGDGMAAITSFGDPVILRVAPHEPIMTDMNATVAWSGSLAPQFKTDVSMRTLIGRASGETIQMRFEGDGFVIIQPYEELVSARADEQ